jgi:hypothetical protein
VLVSGHGPLNRGDEILGVDRLGEQIDRPGLHGLDARPDVSVAADEHDRHTAARGRQQLLQLDPS